MKTIIIKNIELPVKCWSKKIMVVFNGLLLKITELKRAFVWHKHEEELFFTHTIKPSGKRKTLNFDEFTILPTGNENKPLIEKEISDLIFKATTKIYFTEIENKFTNKMYCKNIISPNCLASPITLIGLLQ